MEPLKFDRLPLNTNWFTLLKVTEPAPISGPLKTLGLLDRKLKPTPVPATFNVLVNTRVKLVVSNTTPLLRVRLPGPTALAALRRKVPPLTFTPPRNCAVPWLKFKLPGPVLTSVPLPTGAFAAMVRTFVGEITLMVAMAALKTVLLFKVTLVLPT